MELYDRSDPTSDVEVMTLIQECYAGRIDPEGPERAVRCERFVYGVGGTTEEIGEAILFTEVDYNWSGERAGELLGEHLPEARLRALEAGAEPTPEEHTLFRQRVDDTADIYGGYGAYVYRLTAAPDTGESRPVYFVNGGEQYSHVIDEAGPFTDLVSLSDYLCRTSGPPDMWYINTQWPSEVEVLRALPTKPDLQLPDRENSSKKPTQ